ncbi:MAG: peptidylprolyl isomerase [Myxococcota bacterium]
MILLLILTFACDTPAAPPAADAPLVAPDVPVVSAAPMTAEGLLIPQPLTDDAPQRIAARHILVAHENSERSRYNRSRRDALERAMGLQARLRAEDLAFDRLAEEASDGPSKITGGHLGAFEQGVMHEDFEKVAFQLNVGEISGIVETPFGFHLIQRLALEEVHVAHILVQWKGVRRAEADRTEAQARERAAQALAQLESGAAFADVAREYSDGPTGARGGDLGWFARGQMVPAFDEVAFALAPGDVSAVVETPLGLHIITRIE